MNIFINCSHPAHVHFFKNAIGILEKKGHTVITVSRNKEFTIDLLNSYHIRHELLTDKGRGLFGLIKELMAQQIKIAKILKRQRIDIMLQIGGIHNAPIGKYYRIPTLAFSDTENEKWGNKASFSLSKYILCPTCFDHQVGGTWNNQIHYPGYHELAYLSPKYMTESIQPQDKYLLRFVGWDAGHDLGEKWLSDLQKVELVNLLQRYGTVQISSEMPLPKEISNLACRIHPADIHEFMKSCKMIVGESATMTSESACLGIPAVFISNTKRGYTTEQDQTYGLIKHYRLNQWEEIVACLKNWAASDLKEEWQVRRRHMLADKIEVTDWLVDLIENYPHSIRDAQSDAYGRYAIRCAA